MLCLGLRHKTTHGPRLGRVLLADTEALLDRVLIINGKLETVCLSFTRVQTNLVGSREGGKDELSGPRVARVHGDVVALCDGVDDMIEVRKVEFGRDALGIQVEREGDNVDVPSALAVAKEAALDAVRAGHEAEFGRGDTRAAVVVRVERDDAAVAVADVLAKVLNLGARKVGAGG